MKLAIQDPPDFVVDAAKAETGSAIYYGNCFGCHGEGLRAAGAAPDLRKSGVPTDLDTMLYVVRDGGSMERGMPRFDNLSIKQVEALQHFIRQTARADAKSQRQ